MTTVYPSIFPLRWPRAFYVEPFWIHPYRYECRNAAGGLIGFLRNVNGGQMTQTINSFHKLEFSAPQSEAAYLSGANEIWVRDSKGDLAGKFVFVRKQEQRSGGVVMASCECWSYGAQLAREFVPEYRALPGEHKTLETIIEELLALQVNRRPILIGEIDAAIANAEGAFEFTRVTILSALQSIEETLEAVTAFWVDDDRRLHWKVVSSEDQGLQLRVERNACSIERTVDATEQATRIYAYGKGDDTGSRLKLTDYPGQTEEYIEAEMAGWDCKKQLVVNRSQVSIDTVVNYAGVKNFAVHVDWPADEDLAAYARAGGVDLRFVDSQGGALPYELVSFDKATGALNSWVKFAALSAIYDTPFYLYFGNATANSQSQVVDHNPAGKSVAWVETFNANALPGFLSVGPMASGPGVISKVISDERVTHPETLMRKAQRALLDSAEAKVNYSVEAIDLSETSAAADYARFTLGATVRVIDGEMALDAREVVAELTRELDAPYRVSLQLAETRRNLFDLIADIEDEASEENLTELPETWPADEVDLGDGETMLDDNLFPGTTDFDADNVRLDENTVLDDWVYPDTGDMDAADVRLTDDTTLNDLLYPVDGEDKEGKIDGRKIKGLTFYARILETDPDHGADRWKVMGLKDDGTDGGQYTNVAGAPGAVYAAEDIVSVIFKSETELAIVAGSGGGGAGTPACTRSFGQSAFIGFDGE